MSLRKLARAKFKSTPAPASKKKVSTGDQELNKNAKKVTFGVPSTAPSKKIT